MTSLVLLFRGLCWSLKEREKGKREIILGREWSTRYVIGRAWILGERDKYTNFPCFIQIWAGFNAILHVCFSEGKLLSQRIREWERSIDWARMQSTSIRKWFVPICDFAYDMMGSRYTRVFPALSRKIPEHEKIRMPNNSDAFPTLHRVDITRFFSAAVNFGGIRESFHYPSHC